MVSKVKEICHVYKNKTLFNMNYCRKIKKLHFINERLNGYKNIKCI